MNLNQKSVAVCALLPLMADLIEDILSDPQARKGIFDKHIANNAKTLVKKIRKQDKRILDSAPKEAWEQQVDIQRSVRNFLEKNIKFSNQ